MPSNRWRSSIRSDLLDAEGGKALGGGHWKRNKTFRIFVLLDHSVPPRLSPMEKQHHREVSLVVGVGISTSILESDCFGELIEWSGRGMVGGLLV